MPGCNKMPAMALTMWAVVQSCALSKPYPDVAIKLHISHQHTRTHDCTPCQVGRNALCGSKCK